MSVRFLQVGTETDQLSQCRLALILGVYTNENKIKDFLKFACTVLQVKGGLLAFKNEPYVWYYSKHGFHAFTTSVRVNFDAYFKESDICQKGDESFQFLSQYLSDVGIQHQRLLGFDIRNIQGSIGAIVFFDDLNQEFNVEYMYPVLDMIKNLVTLIDLHKENTELKELYDQAVALNHSKNKFLQVLAHDLRAPFSGLIGFTDVLAYEREHLNHFELQNIVEYLNDTAQSTFELLESILAWAMAEGGRFAYHPINFDLRESTEIVMRVLNGLAQKKNIHLVNNVLISSPVHADINMITSVIQNLVSNALKFSQTDGSGMVQLHSEIEGNRVHLYVQDRGLGMTREQIDNLFDPTLMVSLNGTDGETGAGLGLVLCKRFIDLNFGEISVTSKENEGTIFKVSLPSAQAKTITPMKETIKI